MPRKLCLLDTWGSYTYKLIAAVTLCTKPGKSTSDQIPSKTEELGNNLTLNLGATRKWERER